MISFYTVFDLQTEKGSALHEAALFGKTDVVQILLTAGENLSDKSIYQFNLNHMIVVYT